MKHIIDLEDFEDFEISQTIASASDAVENVSKKIDIVVNVINNTIKYQLFNNKKYVGGFKTLNEAIIKYNKI